MLADDLTVHEGARPSARQLGPAAAPRTDDQPAAVALPARILALGDDASRLHHHLWHLEPRHPDAPGRYRALSEYAGYMAAATDAVLRKVRHVRKYGDTAVEDVDGRLELMEIQARLVEGLLAAMSYNLDPLTQQKRSQHPVPDGLAGDIRRPTRSRWGQAITLVSFMAPDAVAMATSLAVALRAREPGQRARQMSPAQYGALHAAAAGYVKVDREGAMSQIYTTISMGTVRSLQSRDWVRRERIYPAPELQDSRLCLTDEGRLALASRLGRAPAGPATRPRAAAVKPARSHAR